MQNLKLFTGSFVAVLFLLPALCFSQTISIVSGNGQLVCPDCSGGPYTFAPLVVQVNNANGTPAAVGTIVTWTPTQTGLTTVVTTSPTNSLGQASYNFQGLAFFFGYNVLPATVVASVPALNNISVSFVETSAVPGGGGAPAVTASLNTVGNVPPALSGQVGQQATTSITVFVTTFPGAVAGLAVALKPVSSTGPSVSCAPQPGQPAGSEPGIVLTNAAGMAVCTPVFGGTIGTGTYTLVVGGNFLTFGPADLTVAPGPPAIIKYISGNNQTVNPGVTAPLTLTAEVTDLGGNPSDNAVVTWNVTEGTATLSSVVSTSNSTGVVSARVTPTAGPVQVTVALASNKSVQYVFTITVNVVVTSFSAVSATTQSAKIGQAFPDPLIVQANDNGVPVQGATVSFVVISGSVNLSAPSAVTNAEGQAQVSATAGATAGPAVVSAGVTSAGKTYTVQFNLTVNPLGPVITGIANAAGFQNQFVSPCSLAYITGSGFADNIQGVVAAFIEPQDMVNGVTVQFNPPSGPYAPILDIANISGQESMGVQIPCNLPAGNPAVVSTMVVTADTSPSAPFQVDISTYSPGIFQATDPADGKLRAVLVRPDGSFVSTLNPARLGETIRMFVTGLGQTNPPLFTDEFDPLVPNPDGLLVPQLLPVTANFTLGINNSGVTVVAANYAYGMVGVYEIDFVVPENTSPVGNDLPFGMFVVQGTQAIFGNSSLIPVQ